MTQPTREQFLKDIVDHKMTAVVDGGLYRHLRFGRPGTGVMHFDILTWPGYLAYVGDMGNFLFTRTTDMFEFFRDGTSELRISPDYWAEKCVAHDRDEVTEYSPAKFRAAVECRLNDEESVSNELREAVKRDVLSRADDGEHEARSAVREFESEGFSFADFHEHNLRDYTYRFIWCCYAIVWGIKTYDQASVKVMA